MDSTLYEEIKTQLPCLSAVWSEIKENCEAKKQALEELAL